MAQFTAGLEGIFFDRDNDDDVRIAWSEDRQEYVLTYAKSRPEEYADDIEVSEWITTGQLVPKGG